MNDDTRKIAQESTDKITEIYGGSTWRAGVYDTIESAIEKALRPYLALTGKSDEVIEIDEYGKVSAVTNPDAKQLSVNEICDLLKCLRDTEALLASVKSALEMKSVAPSQDDTKRLDWCMATGWLPNRSEIDAAMRKEK